MEVSVERIRQYVGIAALDKANDSRDLYVYCPELLPFLNGNLAGTDVDMPISTTDGKTTYSGSVKVSNVIKCTYRSQESNRLTPPDVRKGEQVIVTCFSDSNTFYWDTAGVDTGTRRTERLIIGVGDTLANNVELTEVNTYCLVFDTRHTKKIRLSTAKSDGERYAYFISMEPKNNRLVISDDDNNTMWIDSENKQVMLSNRSGSLLNIENENIIMSCKGNITIDAKGGDVMIHSGKDTSINSAGTFTRVAGGTSFSASKGTMICCSADSYHGCASSSVNFHSLSGFTVNTATDAQFVAGNLFAVYGAVGAEIVGGSKITVASLGSASFGGATVASMSSEGAVTIDAGGAFMVDAGAAASISAKGMCSISALGALSLSFTGSGVCSCTGGALTMKLSQLNLVQG